MWKVVVTEIQDANVLEPTTVPPGAFFVSTERLSRTVEDLDLSALIQTIDQMQSAQVCRREDRPVFEKIMPRRTGFRTASLREAHVASGESARSRSMAASTLSPTDP
jgi:hypothetical protein